MSHGIWPAVCPLSVRPLPDDIAVKACQGRNLIQIDTEAQPNPRKPIASLTTDKIRDAYDRLCDEGKIASGNSMLRSLRAIYNTWADEVEHDVRNPVSRITKKRGRVKKVATRTGAIAPADRANWYKAIEAQARNSATFSTARAIQALFLTGVALE